MGASESKLPTPEPLSFDDLDFYEILGVSRSFSDEELKQAYRARAKETHPDKDHSDGATERFKKVLEAYETLRSYGSRTTYDETLRQEGMNRATETKPHAPQDTQMPGQYDHNPHTDATESPPPGWFSWLFDRFGFEDPLLRYVPETYIAQNKGRYQPPGMSPKDILDYLALCHNDKNATWEGNDPHKANRMYTLIRNLFECMAYDEKMWGSDESIPHFGNAHSGWCSDDGPSMAHYVENFYCYWLKFETKKTFDWVNPYYTTSENNRRLQRRVEIANAQIHAKCRDQYNEMIREIVVALLHSELRCLPYLCKRAVRNGEMESMQVFCERFIKRHGHRSHAKAQPTRSQGSNPAGGAAGKPTQTKNQKKKQRRKKKKGN